MAYSKKIADKICDRLVQGESLNKICKSTNMPNIRTVFKWLNENEDFKKDYTEARKLQAHTFADMLNDIAQDASGDIITLDGKQVLNSLNLGRAKLQIDALKWQASKLLPKVYSDRTTLAGDDSAPIKVEHTNTERARALASLLAQIKSEE